ncbi:PREDICTED: uncharacterized protein C4orf40 homolog [Chrysochloris asiatica]|uniref:Uncharacterized protein C4orf40 homolog n=1 Tax=Chrysochloris asiatica TaxID=185453 RepID=A0A9B0U714_CHRAS|nr:PREDICTED: uncharacterized protein C4orf40 homolog [Chrysochloris asiatica]
MKLLLWACIVCVALAKRKRFPFIGEDYNGYHPYPLNPSLNNLYQPPTNYFPPPYYPPQNNFPSYPDFVKPGAQIPPYPWVLTAPGAPAFYPNPNYPPAPWFVRPPPPPLAASSSSLPPSSNPEVSAAQPPSIHPSAAKPVVDEPMIAEPASAISPVAMPAVPESQSS